MRIYENEAKRSVALVERNVEDAYRFLAFAFLKFTDLVLMRQ